MSPPAARPAEARDRAYEAVARIDWPGGFHRSISAGGRCAERGRSLAGAAAARGRAEIGVGLRAAAARPPGSNQQG